MIFCSSRERNLKTPKPIKMRTDLLDFLKFKSKLYSNIILTKLLSLSIYVFVVVLLNFNWHILIFFRLYIQKSPLCIAICWQYSPGIKSRKYNNLFHSSYSYAYKKSTSAITTSRFTNRTKKPVNLTELKGYEFTIFVFFIVNNWQLFTTRQMFSLTITRSRNQVQKSHRSII